MAYGLSTRARFGNDPAEQAPKAGAIRVMARSWRDLNATRRLAAVEQALRAANDHVDGYPVAL